MRTSENKNSSARLTETESGNTTPPPTPGPAHSNPTTEDHRYMIEMYDKLYKNDQREKHWTNLKRDCSNSRIQFMQDYANFFDNI